MPENVARLVYGVDGPFSILVVARLLLCGVLTMLFLE